MPKAGLSKALRFPSNASHVGSTCLCNTRWNTWCCLPGLLTRLYHCSGTRRATAEGGQQECAPRGAGTRWERGGKPLASRRDGEATSWENRCGKGSPAPGYSHSCGDPRGNSRALLQPYFALFYFIFVATSGARLQETANSAGGGGQD